MHPWSRRLHVERERRAGGGVVASMKAQTSNALFLGGIVASIALVSVIATPAYATDVATEAAAPVETCISGVCYALPSEPVLELATVEMDDAPAVLLRGPAYRPSDDMLGFVMSDRGSTQTLLGKMDRRITAPADDLIGGSARIPTNFEIEPVRSVAGFGLRSTF